MATTLSHNQLSLYWQQAGGPVSDGNVAAAIAQAESGGDPSKINNTAYPNLPNYHPPATGNQPEYSVGLWQINVVAHPNYTAANMLDPLKNAQAAVAISGNGRDFGAWSTFTTTDPRLSYKQYLVSSSGGGATSGGGTAPAASDATRSTSGWHSINTVLSRRLPGSLHDAQRLRKAALRKLHR
jgi:Lysozyme like domain